MDAAELEENLFSIGEPKAITGDSVVLKFQKARCALEGSLRRVEDIVPQAIGCQISEISSEIEGIEFLLDPLEKQVGDDIIALLQQGRKFNNCGDTNELESFHQAASILGITSSRTALRERRTLKKLIERARVEEDKRKQSIVAYVLHLMRKYSKLFRSDFSNDNDSLGSTLCSPTVQGPFEGYGWPEGNGHAFEQQLSKLSSFNFKPNFRRSGQMAVPPEELRCPISLQLMYDPVIIASGKTYERICIEKWFSDGHNTCPKTQQQLSHLCLTPNYCVKGLVASWCEQNGVVLPVGPPESLDLNYWRLALSESESADSKLMESIGSCKFKGMKVVPLEENGIIQEAEGNEQEDVSVPEDEPEGEVNVYGRYEEFLIILDKEKDLRKKCRVVEEVRHLLRDDEEARIYLGANGFIEALTWFLESTVRDRNEMAQEIGAMALFNLAVNSNSLFVFIVLNTKDGSQDLINYQQWQTPPPESLDLNYWRLALSESESADSKLMESIGSCKFKGMKVVPLEENGIIQEAEGNEQEDVSVPEDEPEGEVNVYGRYEEFLIILDKEKDLRKKCRVVEEVRHLLRDDEEARIYLGANGFIEALTWFLESTVRDRNEMAQEIGAMALFNLAVNSNRNKEMMLAAGVLPLLGKMIVNTSSPASATALYLNLSCLEEAKPIIGSSEAVTYLIEILLGETDPQCKVDALHTLYNLSSQPSNIPHLLSAGIVNGLQALVKDSGDHRWTETSIAVLINLSLSKSARGDIISAPGLISSLSTILDIGEPIMQEQAAACLLILYNGNDKCSQMVLQEGVIPSLVSISVNGTMRGKQKSQKLLMLFREQRQWERPQVETCNPPESNEMTMPPEESKPPSKSISRRKMGRKWRFWWKSKSFTVYQC